MTVTTLAVRTDTLVVTWTDGIATPFPSIWLRDNCPSGLHPETHFVPVNMSVPVAFMVERAIRRAEEE